MDQGASLLGFDSVSGPGGVSSCASASIPYPTSLPSAEFLSVEAHLVTNYTVAIPPGFENSFAAPYSPLPVLNFCNVTLTHTHPGLGDKIKTQVWLPLGDVDGDDSGGDTKPISGGSSPPSWNGRLQGVGGGDLSTGFIPLTQAHTCGEGYAVVTTDGGHDGADWGDVAWALASADNVDWVAVQDAAVIGRAVTENFYDQKVQYAYFTGCSTGGRQAALLAQRWPGDYDGYLAGAASTCCHEIAAALAPQAHMVELGYAPPACELRALRRLAIEQCDGLDGVVDGLVSEPGRCFDVFGPRAHVGDAFVCEETGTTLKITEGGAEVARAAWERLREADGDGVVWGGVGHQADIAESRFSWAATTCDYGDSDSAAPPQCKPKPWPLALAWVQYFLLQDPTPPPSPTAFFPSGQRDLSRLVDQARQWYTSILGTFDPDLSACGPAAANCCCRALGNSRAYYAAVGARDPGGVDGYLRYFEAPGVAHCGIGDGDGNGSGHGLFPVRLLDVLRAWVEEGRAPDSVPAAAKKREGY
ncbi:hypothetical protein PG994_007249 [Apiospora phragmitis]|uniref:Carboxylic ester hydrolase n=1 Tax=Apiospora phragmitis TaxID=2905665 RepID=A0ABR1V2R8_9PEZI